MPAETAPDREKSAEEIELASPGTGALQKVELDLDDAPFLKKEEASPPAARQAEAPAPQEKKAVPGKRQKLFLLGAAALGLLVVIGIGAYWFFGRTPPPPPPALPEPERVLVPTQKPVEAPKEYVKEFAPFVVPRHMHSETGPANPAKGSFPRGDDTRFLVCKFSILATDPNVAAEMDREMMPLRDAVYYYLLSKSSQFLTDAHNGQQIRDDLKGVVNDYLSQGKIESILFESYLNK